METACLRFVQDAKRDIRALRSFRARLRPIALLFDGLFLPVEPGKQLARLSHCGIFALGVLLDLRVPRLQLGFPLLGADFLAIERVALHLNTMQDRRAGGLLIAQRLQGVRRLCLSPQRGRFGLRELADRAQSLKELRLLGLHGGVGRCIVLVMLDRFELAKLGRQLLVFLRLPRLPPQTCELRADLAHHVFQALEIGLCGLEAQLRLMAAAVEPRDTRSVFQDTAALLRLCVDKLPDLALLDERLASARRWLRRRRGFARPWRALPCRSPCRWSRHRAGCAGKFPGHRHR